jgi:hypothetical protein
MTLKGRRFETVSDIPKESSQYSTVLRKIIPTVILKRWKNGEVAVCVHGETISKEMTAEIE